MLEDNNNPIIVSDNFELAILNCCNNYFTVISWIGGKAAIDKTNFGLLVGKSLTYLLRKADDEKTAKRATETAIAFIRKMKSTGFCHVNIYDWERKELIEEKNLYELCNRYGVELPEELASVVNVRLPWSGKQMHIGDKIIGAIIEGGRLTLIHAEYGIGKSFLSMILANIASRGVSLDGSILKFSGIPCRVLYVQQEMQEGNETCDDMAKRQERIDKLFDGNPLPDGAITYYKPTGDLTRVEEQIAVNRKLMEINPSGDIPVILILDNVKSIMPDAVYQANYNKMKPWLDGLKETGVTVLMIHHDGKDGGGVWNHGFHGSC